jgi:hypothetical protein
MQRVTFTDELVVEECPSCFVVFGMVKSMDRRKRNEGGTWYCPNGHGIHAIESEVTRLQKALEREQQIALRKSEQLEAERRSHSATKGQVTRLKNRAAGGACPCCNRTFVQLERHMQTKHPEFAQ